MGENKNANSNFYRPEHLQNTGTHDLIPEESLLGTTSYSQTNNHSANNTNTNSILDEPSNTALLSALDDLSVNNDIYRLKESDNDNTERKNQNGDNLFVFFSAHICHPTQTLSVQMNIPSIYVIGNSYALYKTSKLL